MFRASGPGALRALLFLVCFGGWISPQFGCVVNFSGLDPDHDHDKNWHVCHLILRLHIYIEGHVPVCWQSRSSSLYPCHPAGPAVICSEKRFKKRAGFLRNASQRQFGLRIARYLNRFAVVSLLLSYFLLLIFRCVLLAVEWNGFVFSVPPLDGSS